MSRRIASIDRFAVALTDWVVRRPWFVIVATLLIVAILASGGRHLGLSNNYRVFFSPENPDLVAFETPGNTALRRCDSHEQKNSKHRSLCSCTD